MVKYRLGKVDFAFSFWFFAELACFALLESGALALYLLLPVAVHELGHLIAMRACRVEVRAVSFTAFGVDIRREGGCAVGYGREAAVCLGGVAANLLFALALYLLPFETMRIRFLAASNLAVASFNLAPIGDLDGGQLVKLLAARFFSPAAARNISRAASFLVLGALFGFAGFLLSIRACNPSLLIAAVWLTVNVIRRE